MCYIPPMKTHFFASLIFLSFSGILHADTRIQNAVQNTTNFTYQPVKVGLPDWSQGRGIVGYTGSMRPFFNGGERYVWTKVPYSSLQVGHIVLYRASWTSSIVIHRIKARHVTITGRVIYTMRGDNNSIDDPEYLDANNYIGVFSYRTS
jgi:signal peptidase I